MNSIILQASNETLQNPSQWEERHINTPDTVGESWKYTCPSCGEETIEIGT